MRDTPVRSGGGIAGPDSPVLPGRGLQPRVSSTGGAIDRVWPPNPSATVAGNSLGFLSALSRDPNLPLEVNCGAGYGLAIDPVWSSPVAVIGVSFTGSAPRGSTYIMRPGDFLEVPEGFDRFWIHNADAIDQYLRGSLVSNRGYTSFLITRRPGVRPNLANLRPHPVASIIGAGIGSQSFFTGHLRRLVLDVYPLDAGNLLVSPNGPWNATFWISSIIPIMAVGGAFSAGMYDASTPETPAWGSAASVRPFVKPVRNDDQISTIVSEEFLLPYGCAAIQITVPASGVRGGSTTGLATNVIKVGYFLKGVIP